MHVNAKKMTGAGVLVALTVLLVILSSVIETNTLFLLSAAAFCVGIAIREWGIRLGVCFFVACVLLSVFLAPNKMYCITFAMLGMYIMMSEFLWEKIAHAKRLKRRKLVLWIGKYIIFNCIYIPVLFCFPNLLFTKKLEKSMIFIFLFVGQIGVYIFDKAYMYFQGYIWGKLSWRIHKNLNRDN